MDAVNIGILGLGTVGAGTVNVLSRNADVIARRAGRQIRILMAAVNDISRQRSCDTSNFELTDDPTKIINHPDINVVIELIGGETLARELVLGAIKEGKHVITANKALIAVHGNEIFAAAQENGVVVAFEAAVAGGISIIKAIREGLVANRIETLAGIINGTANYILTGMSDQNCDFDEMLQSATQLGYAESDPTFDIEGIDAAHKLTILAAIAFGIPLQYEQVYVEGISELELLDIEYAESLGFHIKHLGIARQSLNGVELRVHPALIQKRKLLANVDGVMNAVMVRGDAVGETMHYGAGAGAEPTASAVVADLLDVVRAFTTDPGNRVPHLAFQSDLLSKFEILPMEEIKCRYYLRLQAVNRPGVLADVTRILGDADISIEAIQQKGSGETEAILPIVILTQETRESSMNLALQKLEALGTISAKVRRIRVENFDS